MDLGITGKAFVIVGGTAGMGYAAARDLAAEGAKVALIGRNQQAGEAKAAELARETGADVRMFAADGTQPGALEAAIAEAAQGFGQLNGLAVTAGPMLAQTILTGPDSGAPDETPPDTEYWPCEGFDATCLRGRAEAA